jgi:hypothetical protein
VPLRVVERLRSIRNRPLLGLIAGLALCHRLVLPYAAGGVLVGGLPVGLPIAIVSFFAD